jgi:site-specific DNA-methyltransferase (cytosine-N4-specific)
MFYDEFMLQKLSASPVDSLAHPCDLVPGRRAAYKTVLGTAYAANSLAVMSDIPTASIDLVVTSPPYALEFKKEYGNVAKTKYVGWFLPFAAEIKRILRPNGSFVLNIGGSYNSGSPTRSIYHFKLLIALCEELQFHLAQECFWFNPAKLPAPAEWVNVRRCRIKDSVEYVWWFSPSPFPKADNKRVLSTYSADMIRLIKKGFRAKQRPSGHNITDKFRRDKGGSIPSNLITRGNNESNSDYMKRLGELGEKAHPARFPAALPEFYINFLTEPGDLILDPFAGSNTTGSVAESLNRRWISVEINARYVEASKVRFSHFVR